MFMRDLLYNGNPIVLGMAKTIILTILSARVLKVAITWCSDFLIQANTVNSEIFVGNLFLGIALKCIHICNVKILRLRHYLPIIIK